MKTIIILSNSFPPINTISVYRYLSMARYLPKFGWKVIVVTPEWTISNRTQLERKIGALPDDGESVFARWDEEFLPDEGMLVERAPFRSRGDLGENTLQKIWSKCTARYFDYLLGNLPEAMLQKAMNICRQEKVDAILSGGRPEYLFNVSSQLYHKYQIPWIADYRDVVDQSEVAASGAVSYLRQVMARSVLIARNNRHVQSASARITVSEGLEEILCKRNNIPVHVIMNGFDKNDFPLSNQNPEVRNDKFTITYGGTIYPNQHPDIFIEGLYLFLQKTPEARDRVHVRFFGQSSDYLRDTVLSVLGSTVVSLKGTIPRPEMLKHFLSSDILLFLSIKTKGFATGKLFEYLASKRPILSVPGDRDITDKILSKTKAGKVAETSKDVSEALGFWFQEWKDRGCVTIKPDESEISKYSRQSQVKQLAGLLNAITNK